MLADLRRHDEEAATAETRTRYPMVLLARQGQRAPRIARLLERSEETVARVLKRFQSSGLQAGARQSTASRRERTVTAAWEAELLRVIELDPHEVDRETANWTTRLLASYLALLASYLAEKTGIKVSLERVRPSLHALGEGCKRPTWTLKRKAEAQADFVGNACGERGCEPVPVHPNLSPSSLCLRLIGGSSCLPILRLCSLCYHKPISLRRMRCSLPFIQLSPGSGAEKGGAGNAWVSRPGTPARSTAWGCWTAAMAGSMAGLAPGRTADVFSEQGRAAVARSKLRGRVTIVMADTLKIHTSAGSLLVRSRLAQWKDQLYLVYTPAYDPDANRIEWLWRLSRRVVTHNHQRRDFELLVADVESHFQALTLAPEDVLRHIRSPFAPDKVATHPQTLAA